MNERVRLAGLGSIVGGLLWSLAAVVQHGFSYEKPGSGTGYYVVQVMVMLAFVGFFAGVQGLDWTRAAGPGRFGRWSLRIFQIGIVLLLIGTILETLTGNDDIPVFPFGALAITIGGVLAGIAVVRTATWCGWQRVVPLLAALYFVFGMLVPSIFSSGNDGPSTGLVAAWGATWVILGLAFLVPFRHGYAAGVSPELTKARS